MKQMPVILLVMFILTLVPCPASAVKINTAAPDFTLKDITGSSIALSASRGKVVIINFWSVNCAPCVVELPSLSDLYNEMKGEGLVVLGVSLDHSEKSVTGLVRKLKISFPIMLDSKKDVYFDTYGLFGQPVSLVVDRSGILKEKIVGAVEWTSPSMKAKIRSYLKGR